MKISNVLLRFAKEDDLTEMHKMFVDTIVTICKKDYSSEKIDVWIATIRDKQRWIDKINSQYFLIAELDGQIVGYSSLEYNEYIDFLYVHKDYQRQGIADKLYNAIEKEALERKSTILSSKVSITAKPFFEKKGFQTLQMLVNNIQGVEVINYSMVKYL